MYDKLLFKEAVPYVMWHSQIFNSFFFLSFSRGGFSIVDSSTYVEFLGGFHAKPPCRVHRKAHELSLQMPIVLQVKLLPRFQIWAELFQNNCPDLQDIALYFFPSDNTEKYYFTFYPLTNFRKYVVKLVFNLS